MRRDNTNTAEGVATLRLGYVDVSERNCESATLVGQTLRSRLAGDAAPMRMLLPSSVLIGSSHFCPYGGRKQNG
jgi:hypothetical protein